MGHRIVVASFMAGVSVVAVAAPAFAQGVTAPSARTEERSQNADPAGRSQPAEALTSSDGASAAPADDIIVTGSRIARTTFEAPTPVTAISEKQLQQKAATTVTDLLIDIPTLVPNQVQASGRNIGVSNLTCGRWARAGLLFSSTASG